MPSVSGLAAVLATPGPPLAAVPVAPRAAADVPRCSLSAASLLLPR
eukprot:CAMPEP_0174749942 /NCGR_PEP_ID=MMETSP1094-20130205/96752_1 /TAXON_ID=156173 /ORGANISM="Chrysochromulina brevifilum, Strain UTEX LB 985" /LENGTH=45 /DNA_ID= /DNA_START= /DNA_END= /DNA_ORIENTATION=